MKIEIDTEEWDGKPVLIKPAIKKYASNKELPSWEITDIGISFDENETEEYNKKEANKLCDLIIDLSMVEYWGGNNQDFFAWVREALRERLKLVETATA